MSNMPFIVSRVKFEVSCICAKVHIHIKHVQEAKKMNVPPSPPMKEPFSIIIGTDLETAKLANQSKHVEMETPLARTFRGNISGGYNHAMGPKLYAKLDMNRHIKIAIVFAA